MSAFGFHDSGVDRIDTNFLGAEFLGEHAGDRVDCALGGGVYGGIGRRNAADAGPDVDDAGAFAEVLGGGLSGEQEAEDVEVENLVELRLGDGFERAEFVDAGIIDQDIDLFVGLLGFGEELVDVGLLGDVALNGDGFAALADDFVDDFVRALFAGGVINDDRGAFGAELPGDGGADAFRCAGDDRYFPFEFLGHERNLLYAALLCRAVKDVTGAGKASDFFTVRYKIGVSC